MFTGIYVVSVLNVGVHCVGENLENQANVFF